MSNTRARLETTAGNMTIEFFTDKAPGHVDNFLKLVREGFYDGTHFHRIIEGFMIQGGCPNTKEGAGGAPGTGGPGYQIDAEFNDVHHERGVLSMARAQDPNSAGSQFFVCVADTPHLTGQYTAFGRVAVGQGVVDEIATLARDGRDRPLDDVVMTKVTIVKEEQ